MLHRHLLVNIHCRTWLSVHVLTCGACFDMLGFLVVTADFWVSLTLPVLICDVVLVYIDVDALLGRAILSKPQRGAGELEDLHSCALLLSARDCSIHQVAQTRKKSIVE